MPPVRLPKFGDDLTRLAGFIERLFPLGGEHIKNGIVTTEKLGADVIADIAAASDPAEVIDFDHCEAVGGGQIGAYFHPMAAEMYREASQTNRLEVTWTPPVAAWWDIQGQVLMRNDAATWDICEVDLWLRSGNLPAVGTHLALTAPNRIATTVSACHLNGVRYFTYRLAKRIPLSSGVAYAVGLRLRAPLSSGSWYSYCEPENTFIQATGYKR